MERVKLGKTSVYTYIKRSRATMTCNPVDLKINSELLDMKGYINTLQSKIGKEDITEILKNLEYYLPLGNNNKNFDEYIYNSKIFLEVVQCLNFSSESNEYKLLCFIEKFLRGNRHIAKYLSRNIEFVRTVLRLMKKQVI
jgi:hypothetical protein